MDVQVQTFRKEESADGADISEAAQTRRSLLERLNLDTTLQMVDVNVDEATRFYTEFTAFERNVWAVFLRTYYSKSRGEWTDYRFDQIPDEVLDQIALAVEFEAFDDIEIWTPEKKHPRERLLDPMVVGVVGTRDDHNQWRPELHDENPASVSSARFFPVVRWGESLESFEDIVPKACLSVTSWYYHQDRDKDIPPGVLKFIEERLHHTPTTGNTLTRSHSPRSRHCGKQRVVVSSRIRVCGVCGDHN